MATFRFECVCVCVFVCLFFTNKAKIQNQKGKNRNKSGNPGFSTKPGFLCYFFFSGRAVFLERSVLPSGFPLGLPQPGPGRLAAAPGAAASKPGAGGGWRSGGCGGMMGHICHFCLLWFSGRSPLNG